MSYVDLRSVDEFCRASAKKIVQERSQSNIVVGSNSFNSSFFYFIFLFYFSILLDTNKTVHAVNLRYFNLTAFGPINLLFLP